jgi:hypothetical protein
MASLMIEHGGTRARTHTIEGLWATKTVYIDGHSLTVEAVRTWLHRAGLAPAFEPVQTFAWGAKAPLPAVRLLAYGCCECTVPAQWIEHRAAHMALEAFFLRRLQCLRPADFVLHYTETALRQAIRRIQRRWLHQLQQPQHTLHL